MDSLAGIDGTSEISQHSKNFEELSETSIANLALLKGQKLCDMTFVVGLEKKEMKCHKAILSSRSPVFETMFSGNWGSSDVITLEDVLPETLELFLEFIYGHKFTKEVPEAIRVLKLADKYDVKQLLQKCEDLIGQDIKLEDAVQIFVTARSYSLENLVKDAGDLISREFTGLCNDASFQYLDEETLIYLLKRDDLAMAECNLFIQLLRWAKHQMEKAPESEFSYTTVLKNIIPLVRFPCMTYQELSTIVFHSQILSQKDVIDLILYFTSDEAVRNKVAQKLRFSTKPRKYSVEIKLYEASLDPLADDVFLSNCEKFQYVADYESILEFTFKSGVKVAKGGMSQCVELFSLILRPTEYNSFRPFCPPDPDTDIKVSVSVESVESQGGENRTFTNEALLKRGKKLELEIQPPMQLVDDMKYRIKVTFQAGVLAMRASTGTRNVCPSYDILSASSLKKSVSESSLSGLIKLEQIQIVVPTTEGQLEPYYACQIGLHVVRGMNVKTFP